eukprot:SAG25_NODE_177_length_12713_cov_474.755272_1_plen_208_part_10
MECKSRNGHVCGRIGVLPSYNECNQYILTSVTAVTFLKNSTVQGSCPRNYFPERYAMCGRRALPSAQRLSRGMCVQLPPILCPSSRVCAAETYWGAFAAGPEADSHGLRTHVPPACPDTNRAKPGPAPCGRVWWSDAVGALHSRRRRRLRRAGDVWRPSLPLPAATCSSGLLMCPCYRAQVVPAGRGATDDGHIALTRVCCAGLLTPT